MVKQFVSIRQINNRSDRRKAEKELLFQETIFQKIENEFYELLFSGNYEYQLLFRWYRFAHHIKRNKVLVKGTQFIEPNRDYVNNFKSIEFELSLNQKIKFAIRYVRKNLKIVLLCGTNWF